MSLFVGNISKNVKVSELEDEFLKFGACTVKPKVSQLIFFLEINLSVKGIVRVCGL
jgi:RNA recognition motif-containing protein